VATVAAGNPLAGIALYVDPQSKAMAASAGFSGDAQKVKIISEAPQAKWFGDWNPTSTVASTVSAYVGAAAQSHAEPMLVMYAIPHRDCGSYSAGGFADASQYGAWIGQVAKGIAGRRAAVILEPDSLGLMSCLSSADQHNRLAILSNAVSVLAASANTAVYIDGGQSNWLSVSTLATRLQEAGVAKARGFSLNVSNFFSTADELAYGEKVSALIGGKHYVIDTSRNGKGPELVPDPLSWCNPPGRGLGVWPGTNTGAAHADAYLWIKRPGESDGNCRPGNPPSGAWFQSYAVGLVTTAGL
jgi:endoglucanase